MHAASNGRVAEENRLHRSAKGDDDRHLNQTDTKREIFGSFERQDFFSGDFSLPGQRICVEAWVGDEAEALTIHAASSVESYSSEHQVNAACDTRVNAVRCRFKENQFCVEIRRFRGSLPVVMTNQLLMMEPVQK